MDETTAYLERLAAFSRLLRQKGLPIGPRETADGAEILLNIGMDDREQVKTALRTVYAKSREEQLLFDRVFDGFFLPEETIREQARQQAREEQRQREAREEAQQELDGMSGQVHLSEQQQETYTRMSEESRQRLKNFLDRYRNNAERNPALYSEFIHSVFARAIMEQQMLMENAGQDCRELDPELGVLYRDISQFQDAEIPRAIAVIEAVAQQINGELENRNRKAGASGKLDFRKTIRRGLETGGVNYRLSFRHRPPRRRHLVVLCDVSGSMVQFSEFALRLIQSLNRVSENSRVFLFSEALTEADGFRLQNMDRFREYVRQSGIYGKGTDLGTALAGLCALRPEVLTGSTTLLILSDTKTIDQQRALLALEEARRRSGRVLWLNPIPESKWQYLRSVAAFSSRCAMVPCSTLRELTAACRKLSAP